MTRLAALMADSIFPPELPRHFTTTSMRQWLGTTNYKPPRLEDATGRKGPRDLRASWPATTKLIRFSTAKRNGGRRAMHVACPETQLLVCGILNRRWNQIDKLFTKSDLSMAELDYDAAKDKVDWRDYDEQVVETRHQRAAGYQSTLRADISSYYPSIYTHAIAWSVLGRPKSRQKANRSHWANMLDEAVRRSQDDKSNGIPAGLLSSHIIAELIGCAVDRDLTKAHDVVGSRKIDDFLLHFQDDIGATQLRSTLQSVLASYNLYINEAKTKLEVGPHFPVPEWVDKLESIPTDAVKPIIRRQELAQTFVSRIYRLKHKNRSAPVHKKALTKMSIFFENNSSEAVARTCEGFGLNALQSEPESSAEVLALFDRIDATAWKTDPGRLSRVLNDSLENLLPLHHTAESSHLLWVAVERKCKLSKAIWNLIVKNPNVLLAVQAFDLDARGLFDGVGASQRSRLASVTRLLGEDQGTWIFEYEAKLRNWAVPKGSTTLPAMLALMLGSGVSFLSTPP